MDLTDTLTRAQDPDASIRNPAEQVLRQAEEQSLPELLALLAYELANEQKMINGRVLAGLYLKNTLTAKEMELKQLKRARWLQLDPNVRNHVKQLVLNALQSPIKEAGNTGAQIVAAIGAVELPKKQWDDLLKVLLHNVTNGPSDLVRINTLQALGFMCEDLSLEEEEVELPQAATNSILTAIVDGIRAERPVEVRLAAVRALRNSLEFTRGNMEEVGERNVIMQVICEATQCENEQVRRTAFECIAGVALHYYDKLPQYITVLFQLTIRAIREDTQDVGMQAIEFWSTLCDEETALLDEYDDYQSGPAESRPQCFKYVENALPHLIPVLLETLTKQEEHPEEDDWNIAMAGATCLSLVAGTVREKIIQHVIPFVQPANLTNENWRFREAAVLAFGSILDGPSTEHLAAFIPQAMSFLIQGLQDAHTAVKDTTAWTIGTIFKLHAPAVPPAALPHLIPMLLIVLDGDVHVARKACFAILNIGEYAPRAFPVPDDSTNVLSPYMSQLLQKLLLIPERPDAKEGKLTMYGYEAANMLIQNAAPDCYPFILQNVVPLLIHRLTQTFSVQPLSADDFEDLCQLQSYLCGCLFNCLQKLDKGMVPFCDQIMQLLIEIFRRHKHVSAHEEAYFAVGAVANVVEGDFLKYMPVFREPLLNGLRNYEDHALCIAVVNLVVDLVRALEKNIAQFCPEIIDVFLSNLKNQAVHRSVKPHILACLGDIALNLGAQFEIFLPQTMLMLRQASMATLAEEDDEMIEHFNKLRESVLDAYIGIVQGFSADKKTDLLLNPQYINPLIEFLIKLSDDAHIDEEVLRRAVGLVGDLGNSLREKIAPYINLGQPWVQKLMRQLNDTSEQTKHIGQYTQQVLTSINMH